MPNALRIWSVSMSRKRNAVLYQRMPLQTPTTKFENCAANAVSTNDPSDLSDLFAEGSLWEIYRKSRAFYRNRFNRVVAVAWAAMVVGFSALQYFGVGL